MSELRILGISGSLRSGSYNTALLRTARRFAPEGAVVEIYGGLRAVPPFDQDLDADVPPEPVADLRRRIGDADGVVIATPEYNAAIPGVLKNALDWASRPTDRSCLQGKPVAIMGASPGGFGTQRAQAALRPLLELTSRVVAAPEVMVPRAFEHFDDAGDLRDEQRLALVTDLLDALVNAIRSEPVRS